MNSWKVQINNKQLKCSPISKKNGAGARDGAGTMKWRCLILDLPRPNNVKGTKLVTRLTNTHAIKQFFISSKC